MSLNHQAKVLFKIDAARLVVDQEYKAKDASERLGLPLSNMTIWLKPVLEGKIATLSLNNANPVATPEIKEVSSMAAAA